MRRKDENGFTLVELVISMGMFSIVMLAIMFFLTAGTKSYGHSKSESVSYTHLTLPTTSRV